ALVWLHDQSQTVAAAQVVSAHASEIFLGQVLAGPLIDLLFADPATSARTPDLIVTPNVGTIYSTSGKKIAAHGGFWRDDTNVLLLVSNPAFAPETIPAAVQTTQIAPTILKALGIKPHTLQAVQIGRTGVLPVLGLK